MAPSRGGAGAACSGWFACILVEIFVTWCCLVSSDTSRTVISPAASRHFLESFLGKSQETHSPAQIPSVIHAACRIIHNAPPVTSTTGFAQHALRPSCSCRCSSCAGNASADSHQGHAARLFHGGKTERCCYSTHLYYHAEEHTRWCDPGRRARHRHQVCRQRRLRHRAGLAPCLLGLGQRRR